MVLTEPQARHPVLPVRAVGFCALPISSARGELAASVARLTCCRSAEVMHGSPMPDTANEAVRVNACRDYLEVRDVGVPPGAAEVLAPVVSFQVLRG